ncbi:hypothetical protein [Ruegeria sp. HKCCD7255]|nr:hypothetical protein [Ruegeria sp. HKCCD7255]
MFLGQGDMAGLHHPAYGFNDNTIPFGCAYWVELGWARLAALEVMVA